MIDAKKAAPTIVRKTLVTILVFVLGVVCISCSIINLLMDIISWLIYILHPFGGQAKKVFLNLVV
ncbi:hypothetical protein ACFL04_00150 [Patescibacteria group bacterium]